MAPRALLKVTGIRDGADDQFLIGYNNNKLFIAVTFYAL